MEACGLLGGAGASAWLLPHLDGREILESLHQGRAARGRAHTLGPAGGRAEVLQGAPQLLAQRAEQPLRRGGLLRRRRLLGVLPRGYHREDEPRHRREGRAHELRGVLEELGPAEAQHVAPGGDRRALVLENPRGAVRRRVGGQRGQPLPVRRRRLRAGLRRGQAQERLLGAELGPRRVHHEAQLLVELARGEQRVGKGGPGGVGERPRAEAAADEGEAEAVEDGIGEGHLLARGLRRGLLRHRLPQALVPGGVEQLLPQEEQPAPDGVGGGGGARRGAGHAVDVAEGLSAGVRQDAGRLRLQRRGGGGGDAAGSEHGAEEAHGVALRAAAGRGPG